MKSDNVQVGNNVYDRRERLIEDLKILAIGAIGIFALIADWWFLG